MAVPSPSGAKIPRIPAGERVYAIGDIHGRFDLLQALVSRIRADSAARRPARVRLILLGDLVDRGPDSAAVVEQCRVLATRSDAFVVLKGNHEAMMLDALGGNLNALAVWLRNGGDAALASWGVAEDAIADALPRACITGARQHVPAKTLAWLAALPASLIVGDYLFVHAGIRPDVPIARQTPQDMLWIRNEFLESDATHPHVVIHGHSIAETVEVRPNRIGIDTGAYRTGVLTALMLEDDDSAVLSTAPGDPAMSGDDGFARDVGALLGFDPAAPPAAASGHRGRIAAAGVAGVVCLGAVAAILRPAPPAPRPPAAAARPAPVRVASAAQVPTPVARSPGKDARPPAPPAGRTANE